MPPKPSFGRSVRRFLLFNVLTHDGDGCATTASGEVRRRPERLAPQFLPIDQLKYRT
jgi:hypothetical protein